MTFQPPATPSRNGSGNRDCRRTSVTISRPPATAVRDSRSRATRGDCRTTPPRSADARRRRRDCSNAKRLSRQRARNAAIASGEASGQGDQTPAIRPRRWREGEQGEQLVELLARLRAAGPRSPGRRWRPPPRVRLRTRALRAARRRAAPVQSRRRSNAPRSSSTTKLGSGCVGAAVWVYSHRARNRAVPPASPALSSVRRVMRLPSCSGRSVALMRGEEWLGSGTACDAKLCSRDDRHFGGAPL